MRLTLRFLVKSFALVALLLFLLPVLIHRLDSQEEAIVRERKLRVSVFMHSLHRLYLPEIIWMYATMTSVTALLFKHCLWLDHIWA